MSRPHLLDSSITDSWFGGQKPSLIMNNSNNNSVSRNVPVRAPSMTDKEIFSRKYNLIGGSESLKIKESLRTLYKQVKEHVWTIIGCVIILVGAYMAYKLRQSYIVKKRKEELRKQREAKINDEIPDDISEFEEESIDEGVGLNPNISQLGIDLEMANVHDNLPTMNFHPNPEPIPQSSM